MKARVATWGKYSGVRPADFVDAVEQTGNIRILSIRNYIYTGTPRNKPCPCGSGKKYKRCCAGKKQEATNE